MNCSRSSGSAPKRKRPSHAHHFSLNGRASTSKLQADRSCLTRSAAIAASVDPRSVARALRRMGKEMGDEMGGPEFDEAVDQLERGGDLDDDGGDDSGGGSDDL